jgi:thiamine-phosphate pyrophosphorylase
MASQRRTLPWPAIMLVTDSSRRHGREAQGQYWLDDVVREATLGGVNVVQLREKQLSAVELIDLGLHVRDAITDRALLLVNSDIGAAITLGADGVHLPEEGDPIAAARDRLAEGMLISRAVHSIDAARLAADEGADVLQAGTVFETASKPGAPLLGLEGLREICDAVRVPVIAIGGITAANAASVMEAGAAGVAVIGAIFDADDPRAAAAELHRAVLSGMRR